MSMGICDRCLEVAFHARMEDGHRILLDPASGAVRYMFDPGELEIHPAPQTKRRHDDAAVIGDIEISRGIYAYKVISYELHVCPEKELAPDPATGEKVGVS